VLAIQENEFIARDPSSSDQSPAWRPLATAAAEHIALALSNLSLRETLRIQAVRDPLTGLYNRRYMQEFLERELQRSRRQRRPLSVGCTTLKLGRRPAGLPVILEPATELTAPQGDNGIGSTHCPEHTREFQSAQHSFATGLDYSGAHK
jgi:hypothetical protein